MVAVFAAAVVVAAGFAVSPTSSPSQPPLVSSSSSSSSSASSAPEVHIIARAMLWFPLPSQPHRHHQLVTPPASVVRSRNGGPRSIARDPVGSDGGWGWEASPRCAPSGAAGASRDVPGRILMVGAPQVVPGVVRGGGDYPGMSLREMVGWPGGRDLCLGGSGGPGTCPGCVWGRGVRGGSSSGKHGRQIRRQFRETRPQ